MQDPLKDLTVLTDALFQSELAKMQELNLRETQLRGAIAELDTHHRDNQNLPDAQLIGARKIGADILWQSWLSRNKTELNVSLAQVMAQKERLIHSLREAFGKNTAANAMLKVAQADQCRVNETRNRQNEEELQLLKSGKT